MTGLVCVVCPVRQLPELWRPVPLEVASRYGHTYEASTLGRVRNRSTLRVLSPGVSSNGYLTVELGGRSQSVHRLVALTWLGPPPRAGGPWEVDHLDFDRHNNVVHNLRWLTKATNAWRWKFWAEEPPAEWVEPTPEEVAADEARRVAAGWPPARPRRPHEQHRHVA